jgi:POT family proton-dependent oligopeptide transporter
MSQAQETGVTLDMPIDAEGTPPRKGHPKGLGVLFTTEMWERFNFYGMRAILSLFLINALAFKDSDSSLIYGGFLGLCYLTPMLGGFMSDKFLGNRNCITIGGLTMALGQFMLFMSASNYKTDLHFAQNIMYLALGVIILGNGFFKPNISSMVGSLYPKGDSRLDSAFTIFYMGINVGAFLGNYICSTVGDVKHGDVRVVEAFKYGFLAAGLAMLLATVIFYILKNKYIVTPEGKPIGGRPSKSTAVVSEDDVAAKFTGKSMALVGMLMLALYFVFQNLAWDPIAMPMAPGSSGIGAYFSALAASPIKTFVYPFIYASGLSLATFILTDKSLTKVETQRILVIYIVGFFVIFFWACFEQAGSSLTFIADQQTDTNILGWQMPPSLVQNFNAIFIVIFAFPFSWMWVQLAKKGKEPISPVKQSIGLLLLAAGYFVIAMRVRSLGMTEKMSVGWLIILYLLHTLGELCLSPIGLSLVSKLSPKRFSSLLFGVFFLSNAAGYALAGTLGALIPNTTDKFVAASKHGIDLQAVLDKKIVPTTEQMNFLQTAKINIENTHFAGFTIHNLFEFFMVFVVLSGVASLLLFLLSGTLKKMMHGVR